MAYILYKTIVQCRGTHLCSSIFIINIIHGHDHPKVRVAHTPHILQIAYPAAVTSLIIPHPILNMGGLRNTLNTASLYVNSFGQIIVVNSGRRLFFWLTKHERGNISFIF